MSLTNKIRHHLYLLKVIEKAARKRFPDCSFLYLQCVTHEFVSYYRYLLVTYPEFATGAAVDTLVFHFEQQLVQIFRAKADFVYLAFEMDDKSVYPVGHIVSHCSRWLK